MSEHEIKDIEPITLQEIGFLVRETDEAVTLALEAPAEHDTSVRMWICIPKRNILARYDVELAKAFPIKKKRTRAG